MSDNFVLIKIPKNILAIGAVSALLLVIMLQLGVLGGSAKIAPGNTPNSGLALPVGAKLYKLAAQSLENNLAWQGAVRSRLAVRITPKYPTRIIEIPVHVGDKVKQGAVLVRLDNRELRAAYEAAAAALNAAQSQAKQADIEAKRITELYEKQAATRQNYDAVMAQAQTAAALLKQAGGRVEQSKAVLSEDVIYAPFDGVVGERLQDPGDMAQPNQAILTFHQPGDLRLEAAIAEQCQSHLQPGQIVNVQIDALAQNLSGKIEEISPEIDPQTHSRLLKIALPPTPGLAHGQFGRLELACQHEQSMLLIPASAVLHYGQLQAVRVVEGEYTHIRHIRTGKAYGLQLEVLSGLHADETIMSEAGLAP